MVHEKARDVVRHRMGDEIDLAEVQNVIHLCFHWKVNETEYARKSEREAERVRVSTQHPPTLPTPWGGEGYQ